MYNYLYHFNVKGDITFDISMQLVLFVSVNPNCLDFKHIGGSDERGDENPCRFVALTTEPRAVKYLTVIRWIYSSTSLFSVPFSFPSPPSPPPSPRLFCSHILLHFSLHCFSTFHCRRSLAVSCT